MSKRRKPARLVTDVTPHEPSTEISPAGELHTVQRADVSVTDRSTGQRIRFKGVLDVDALLRTNPT